MNLTLAFDDALLKKAREIAARQGTSLNDLLRAYLETLVGSERASVRLEELTRLWDTAPGRSGDGRFDRDDAYRGRV